MSTYSAAEITKQHLISAAGELAAMNGFDNISTRAIAERSGENIGSIHYHFGGKDGLLAEVVHDAVGGCTFHESTVVEPLGENPSREELSAAVREIVSREIADLFLSNRPLWHSQVIYQLMQRDDELYDIFRRNVLESNLEATSCFFKLIDPSLSDQESFAHITVLKMPIIAHANYRKVMLEHLGAEEYPEDYLKILEDLLVKQTQLLFGLPLI